MAPHFAFVFLMGTEDPEIEFKDFEKTLELVHKLAFVKFDLGGYNVSVDIEMSEEELDIFCGYLGYAYFFYDLEKNVDDTIYLWLSDIDPERAKEWQENKESRSQSNEAKKALEKFRREEALNKRLEKVSFVKH